MALRLSFGDELTHGSPGSATRNAKNFRKEVYPRSCRSALGQVSDQFDVCSSSNDHGTILHLNVIEMQLCAKFSRVPTLANDGSRNHPDPAVGVGTGWEQQPTKHAEISAVLSRRNPPISSETSVQAGADEVARRYP